MENNPLTNGITPLKVTEWGLFFKLGLLTLTISGMILQVALQSAFSGGSWSFCEIYVDPEPHQDRKR
jgi:hypothetical protein